MSDRGNVMFCRHGEGDSVIVSAYWGGMSFVETAIHYAIALKKEVDELRIKNPNFSTPLTELEPQIVAVDFIHYLVDKGWIKERDSAIYLCRNESEVYGKVYRINLENPEESLSVIRDIIG